MMFCPVQELLAGLQQLSSSTAPGIAFKAGKEWQERLAQVGGGETLFEEVKKNEKRELE